MVPEFWNACTKLKNGEISQPVKSKFGYHVIKRTG
ncbi:MAG: peptidylprolyl isomerase [Promethearchaeota archaeon]